MHVRAVGKTHFICNVSLFFVTLLSYSNVSEASSKGFYDDVEVEDDAAAFDGDQTSDTSEVAEERSYDCGDDEAYVEESAEGVHEREEEEQHEEQQDEQEDGDEVELEDGSFSSNPNEVRFTMSCV